MLGATPEVILGQGKFSEAQLLEAELLSLWRILGDEQHSNILSIMRSLAGQGAVLQRTSNPPAATRKAPLT